MTSPAGGAVAIGLPWPPAQTMPVKWTGLPAELIVVPSPSATRACQAAQPRSSSQGRRIASPKPGRGAASGLSTTRRSPRACAAPSLQPAAKPALRPLRTIRAAGRQRRHRLGGPVARSRCRRRSARPPRPARAAGQAESAPAPRGCSRRRSGPKASGAPTREAICSSVPPLVLLAAGEQQARPHVPLLAVLAFEAHDHPLAARLLALVRLARLRALAFARVRVSCAGTGFAS